MKPKDLVPYKNESDAVSIGDDLNIENRLDCVSIFGNLDLTKDKEGLEKAMALKEIVDRIVATLEASTLVDKTSLAKNVKKGNIPFAD